MDYGAQRAVRAIEDSAAELQSALLIHLVKSAERAELLSQVGKLGAAAVKLVAEAGK